METLEESEDRRYIINRLALADARWTDDAEFRVRTEQACAALAETIRRVWLDHPSTWKALDIYTGVAGVLFSQFKLSDAPYCTALTKHTAELVQIAKRKYQLKCASRRPLRPAFLDGISGYFVALALCSPDDRQDAISACMGIAAEFLTGSEESMEMLYGAAGYLHGLLLIHRFCGARQLPLSLLYDLLRHIVAAGTQSEDFAQRNILTYHWHGKMYLGGAHGLCGILLQLLYGTRTLERMLQQSGDQDPRSRDEMQAFVCSSRRSIRTSIDFLLDAQFPSGNLPSSPTNTNDRLVQWCHGSVSMVSLLCIASEIYEEPDLIRRAVSFADAVWARGLLWKGTGLCHGISGNGYVFLTMYRATQDEAWLHKARAFAVFASDHVASLDTPDKPWSLFEGRLGELCFLHDCIHPEQSWFPCYELPA